MDDYGLYDQWSVFYDPQAAAAAAFEWKDDPTQYGTLTDPKVLSDVTAAKKTAVALNDTKLASVLDFILKYGDKALTTLSKTGIIKNQNLQTAGYSFTVDNTPVPVSQAPAPQNRVFNLDFTDPKVLIIIFLVMAGGLYFLLKPAAKAKR